MTDSLKEQLSACLDGELPEGELDLLLKRFERDSELRETLGRYSLITQALQAKQPVAASAQFASRVMAVVEGEAAAGPAFKKRTTANAMRWLRPVAGLAVAAGVATVAILSVQQPAESPLEPIAQQQSPVDASGDGSYIVPEGQTPITNSLIPATRLTNYVVAHSEYSSPLGMLSGVADDDVEQQGDDAAVDDQAVVSPVDTVPEAVK
jgi:sigma-E factor negative regulatory protein RseA